MLIINQKGEFNYEGFPFELIFIDGTKKECKGVLVPKGEEWVVGENTIENFLIEEEIESLFHEDVIEYLEIFGDMIRDNWIDDKKNGRTRPLISFREDVGVFSPEEAGINIGEAEERLFAELELDEVLNVEGVKEILLEKYQNQLIEKIKEVWEGAC